jgi:hypothetical protein
MVKAEAKTSETKAEENLKPPYGNVSWYATFFEKIRDRDFDLFDKSIIELNIIKGPNATMVFNGLRFLGLVEQDGRVTEKFKSLRRFGDEFKKNLKPVVEEAYSLLFSKVVVESAKLDSFLSFFAETYGYGKAAAGLATKIFVYLCNQAEIPISEELTAGSIKIDRGKRKRKPPEDKSRGSREISSEVPKGMHKIEWGNNILIFLKESEDKSEREKIANQAKQLIDMYCEG